MESLSVRRLDASYRLAPEEMGAGPLLDRAFRRLAEGGLARTIHATTLPTGEWCVRRLEVPVFVRLDGSERSVEEHWAASVVGALQRALETPSANIVHYRSRRDALVELVGQTAVGRSDRAWAWEQVGVRLSADPTPELAPADAILAALCRAPYEAHAILIDASLSVGLAALDRTLGIDGWLAATEIIRSAIIGEQRRGTAPVSRAPETVPPDVGSLVDAILSTSRLANAIRRSRLSVDGERAATWAVLVALEVEPCLFRRADPHIILAGVAASLATDRALGLVRGARVPSSGHTATSVLDVIASEDHGARPGRPARPRSRHQRSSANAPESEAMSTRQRAARAAPATSKLERRIDSSTQRLQATGAPVADRSIPEPMTEVLPDSASTEITPMSPTVWAGLLFLHNVSGPVGLPDLLLDDPVLGVRPLRWVLHAIARELVPVDPGDPAALAFAGLGPAAVQPSLGSSPATAGEQARIRDVAAMWATALAERVGEPGDPVAAVKRVANRSGEVTGDPGWIEIHLRLGDVDVSVRKAGLDLDPGWIAWLGCVVRFVYA